MCYHAYINFGVYFYKSEGLRMFEKLYSIKLPLDERRQELYIKGKSLRIEDGSVFLKKNQTLDLGTYFNLFSAQKWEKYTSINAVKIQLNLKGKYTVTVVGIRNQKQTTLLTEAGEDEYQKIIPLADVADNFLSFEVTALEDDVQFFGGAYYGEFAEKSEADIGIIICTFKREDYVKRNLETLKGLMRENPHFHVMIVDNGRTLPEVQETQLQIIHNRNYGGSGGFTRGLIEQVNQGINDYVLMMDDDILIETSSLERVYALCCYRNPAYKMQMIAGSMMSMDQPTLQYENTAYWGKIRMHALGRYLDLTMAEGLLQNDNIPEVSNKYAAWWFCCIPMAVIEQNGYPLPAFIKSDDMEYGIRNRQDIITMNGIGVWHETFNKKENAVVNYFNDRNMLILNHYTLNCSRWHVLGTALGRLAKHILRRNISGIRMFEIALQDYKGGYEKITSLDADVKLRQIQNYHGKGNIFWVLMKNLALIAETFAHYHRIHENYIMFRRSQLMNQKFWKTYLHLK